MDRELTLVWPPEPMFARLHRMPANLLATPRAARPSGRVIIEVVRRASRMILVVEDNGPGFGGLPEGRGGGQTRSLARIPRERSRPANGGDTPNCRGSSNRM